MQITPVPNRSFVRHIRFAMNISGDGIGSLVAEKCSPNHSSEKPSRSANSAFSVSSASVSVKDRPGGCTGIMNIPRRMFLPQFLNAIFRLGFDTGPPCVFSCRSRRLLPVKWGDSAFPPNLASQIEGQAELFLLDVGRNRIPGIDAGEAALRADGKAIKRQIARRLFEPQFEIVFAFDRRGLRRNDAKHDAPIGRHPAQRTERSGAFCIIFEKIEVDVERVEQPVGDHVVAAFRVPSATSIPSTQMQADPQTLRRICQYAVGDNDVFVNEGVPVVAARLQPRLHLRIAEFGERCFVDLHIPAARVGQSIELFAEGRRYVIPKLFDIRVCAGKYRGVATTEVQSAWPWYRDLWNKAGVSLDEFKILHIDRLCPDHAAVDQRHWLSGARAGLPIC